MLTVKEVVDEWDPINLLSHAPKDEYHSEIEKIEHLLRVAENREEAAYGIFNIFSESFGNDIFLETQSECELIARKLLDSVI